MSALTDLHSAISGTSGCFHAFGFQETSGTTCTDAKGNQNGTYQGTPNSVTGSTLGADGPMGGSAFLNRQGATNHMNVPANAALNAQVATVTIVAMVRRLKTHSGNAWIFANRSTAQWQLGFVNNQIRFHKNSGGATSGAIFTSSETFTDVYKWHLVVMRYDGSQASMRVDGVELTRGAGTNLALEARTQAMTVNGDASAAGEASIAGLFLFDTYVSTATVQAWEALWSGKSGRALSRRFMFGVHGERNALGTSDRALMNTNARSVKARIVRSKANIGAIYAVGVGSPDWTSHDTFIGEVEAAGMENLLILFGVPAFQNSSAGGHVWPVTDVANDPLTDPLFSAALANWQTECQAVFQRYMVGGTAGRHVRYFECWNEPNDDGFMQMSTTAAPSAKHYAAIWNACKTAALAADPNFGTSSAKFKVAMGALASLRAAGGADIAGITFIDSLVTTYSASFTNLSIHPYDAGTTTDPTVNSGEASPTNDFDNVQLIRDYLQQKQLSSVKLWLTEWGWSVPAVTTANQAAYLTSATGMIRDYWGGFVDVATWFSDFDSGSLTYGLWSGTTAPFTARTVATNFKTFASLFGGGRRVPRVPSIPVLA